MGHGLRHLGPGDWPSWRAMRLAALGDSPSTFGSTLAAEQAYTESDWRAWLAPDRGLKVVADDDAGMVGAWTPPDRDGAAELYSMWVHPDRRGQGLGRLLVDEAITWAAGTGHPSIHLWVTDGNTAAERLYRRHGFQPTGESQPHPAFPGVAEHLMSRSLGR